MSRILAVDDGDVRAGPTNCRKRVCGAPRPSSWRREGSMVATRFARLRRARDRHGSMVATRFARLRRARDRHGGRRC
ncbi:hypothetical protein CKJ67_19255 [Mycobacterium intracellulare]|nr:hypothetical protein CKJ67_19255 [Mycobacterium intracellulare]